MKRILAALLMAIASTPAYAAAALAPNTITYSGYLVKPGGAPETASVSIVFTLYEDSAGTMPVWTSPATAITPDANGFFTMELGVSPAFSAAVNFDNAYYLGIKVGAEAEMVPRLKVGSAPRALSVDWSGIAGFNGVLPCGPGQVVKGFNADGSLNCVADADSGGTVTGVAAAANGGITIGGTAAAPTVGLTSAGCTPGQVLTFVSPGWGCTTPTTGAVTSVGGSAPISSSGGASPVISIAQAGASSSGYLSSIDWNTFNSKGSGTVTSVGSTSNGGIAIGGSAAAPTVGLSGSGCSTSGQVLTYLSPGWGCTTPAASVLLQGATPGVAQSGHLNVTGTIVAGTFSGNLSGNATSATSATGLSCTGCVLDTAIVDVSGSKVIGTVSSATSATNATNASTVPWSGVSGRPQWLMANGPSTGTDGINATLVAGGTAIWPGAPYTAPAAGSCFVHTAATLWWGSATAPTSTQEFYWASYKIGAAGAATRVWSAFFPLAPGNNYGMRASADFTVQTTAGSTYYFGCDVNTPAEAVGKAASCQVSYFCITN